MSKRKYDNTPVILKDMNRIFNASTGISYEKYKKLFDIASEKLAPEYQDSVYARITAMADFTHLKDDQSIGYFIRMTMFYYWSLQKEIYQFDTDFAEELLQTEVKTIPYESLKYLPYDTLAITIEDDYIIVHKCYDRNHTRSDYLFIAYVKAGSDFVNNIGIPLSKEYPDVESLKVLCENPKQLDNIINCLNLIMYLCSEKSDIQENPEQKTITRRDKKIRNTYREIRKWDVGYRFGAAFRKEKSTKYNYNSVNHDSVNYIGSKKRPHIRRGHWHSFWTGKHDSPDRKLVIKWLSPIAINIEDTDSMPAVIHETNRM